MFTFAGTELSPAVGRQEAVDRVAWHGRNQRGMARRRGDAGEEKRGPEHVTMGRMYGWERDTLAS